jgi:hypothetical protein
MSTNSRNKLAQAVCIREVPGFISAATLNILSKAFLGFVQYIEANSRKVAQIRPQLYPFHVASNVFFTILYLSILVQ